MINYKCIGKLTSSNEMTWIPIVWFTADLRMEQ